ncbi:MAG: hypothetical protein V1794_12140 [Candidatus Glassbacteria bacterium]
MNEQETNRSEGRTGRIGLAALAIYVIVLALAAVSEVFDLGWFDNPFFK